MAEKDQLLCPSLKQLTQIKVLGNMQGPFIPTEIKKTSLLSIAVP